jgi:nucleotide-binding universal stress UspA family protein
MKRILLCTDGSSFAESSYQYGAWFATRLGATVDVLYVTDARSQAAAEARNFTGSLGFGASETLLDRLVTLEHEKAKLDRQRAQLILQTAQQILDGAGVESIQLLHETGFLVDYLHQFEDRSDVIILGKRGETAAFASSHLGANVERIVRSTHKPCLVVSHTFKPIERLLLAYDGSPSCQKMLQFLLASPAFQGLELHIVTVAKKSDDSTANFRLESAKLQAHGGGFEPICHLTVGHPEEAIAEYSAAKDISLLMMGAYGHSRIRHLVLGSTTAQILRSSPICVLVFR